MCWIDDESIRLQSPLFAYEPVWREPFEGLEVTAEVAGVDEVLKAPAQVVAAVIVAALDCGVLDGPVHALDPLPDRRLRANACRATDVKVPDRVALELLFRRFVAFDLRKPLPRSHQQDCALGIHRSHPPSRTLHPKLRRQSRREMDRSWRLTKRKASRASFSH